MNFANNTRPITMNTNSSISIPSIHYGDDLTVHNNTNPITQGIIILFN